MSISIVNAQTNDHTVDASEIPRPTTERMYKTLVNNGDKLPIPQLVSLPENSAMNYPRSMEQLYCAIRQPAVYGVHPKLESKKLVVFFIFLQILCNG